MIVWVGFPFLRPAVCISSQGDQTRLSLLLEAQEHLQVWYSLVLHSQGEVVWYEQSVDMAMKEIM